MRKLYFILILILLPALLRAQPIIHITTPSDTICSGTLATFTANTSGISSAHYHWRIDTSSVGADTLAFTTDSLHNGDMVYCLLTNIVGDTVFARSDTIIVTVLHIPSAGTIIGPGDVCLYATITLSDSVAGGVWGATNNYAADTAGVVTGKAVMNFESVGPAFDTITYVVTNACGSDTTLKPIVIDPLPDAYIEVDGGGPYCIGGSASINNGYGVNGYIYATNGNASVDVFGVSFNHVGVDTIICIDSNYCGISIDSVTVSTSPLPTIHPIITSSSVLCMGLPIILKDSSANCCTSNWHTSNNNAYLSNVNIYTDMLIGNMVGLDTITFEYWYECSYGSGTSYHTLYTSTIISVEPPYPIRKPETLCAGISSVLFDSSIGGTWTSANNAIGTIESYNGFFTGISGGIDTIRYTLSTGCFVETTVTVNQSPAPITVSTNILCADSTMYISDISPGSWSISDTSLAFVDRVWGTLTGTGPGYVTLYFTTPMGCYDSTIISIANCDLFESIYPNPSTDEITIQANPRLYQYYTFSNLIGQVIMQAPITSTFTKVDVSLLPPAIYFISLYGVGYSDVTKFLKK